MIRPEVRDALIRWREVIVAAAVALFGLMLIGKGWLLGPIGALLLALGAALAITARRRMRFAGQGDAPGMVEVVEGQISYLGPEGGGFVSVTELSELRLLPDRVWRLRQVDGQTLLVPADAAGAEALFDVFASLPGMDAARLVAAKPDTVIWSRHLRLLT